MTQLRILTGDVLDVLLTLPSASFDAVLSDPPYGISFAGREWDKALPNPRVWKELFRVLRPGGQAIIFGACRTFHRACCSIEDAGFELRDVISWIQANGMPKDGRVGKRATAGSKVAEIAQGFSGTLKPAWEPAMVFRKPGVGTMVDGFRANGLGAFNVDAGKLPSGRWPPNVALDEAAAAELDAQVGPIGKTEKKAGRKCAPKAGYGGFVSGYVDDIDLEKIEGASGFFYAAKAKSEDEMNRGLPDGEDNPHPTLKPIALTQWLATLLIPPPTRRRRILIPFSGAGSEAIGAGLAGWEDITGIEREAAYVRIAQLRFPAWVAPGEDRA